MAASLRTSVLALPDISIFDAGAEILFSCHPVHAFRDASQDGMMMRLGLWTLASSSSGQM